MHTAHFWRKRKPAPAVPFHTPQATPVARMASIQGLSVELLECILSHLSMWDLLRLQRVCTDWRDVIRSSPQLQRDMFLGFVPSDLSNPAQLARFVHDNSKSASTLHKPKKPRSQLDNKADQSKTESQEPGDKLLVRINPVFLPEGDIIRTRTTQFREPLDSPLSWLDMFLTQPPCSYAEAAVFFTQPSSISFRGLTGRGSDTGMAIVRVTKTGGVRARDVLQEIHGAGLSKPRRWQRIDIHVPGVSHK